ncbi:hypothetical protein [Tumebacillus flagellatus]|uniref:Tetratricopeptide repeat protein n=1 Tax=Tumebacillus flagellatus TaxID=1157490 RepID=A0A074LPA4_9BACL|nr:hypothetical protein [Tumebacillus flagellatus]KEO81643.1 hypothetical protein EL26_19415 [Tumebacillus flagellatus]
MSLEKKKVKALDLMEVKDYANAITLFKTIIQSPEFDTFEEKHLVYQSLGVSYLEMHAFDDAISALKASLACSPEPIETADYVTLADTHSFLSVAYEEKSAFGFDPVEGVKGAIAWH